MSAVLTPDLGLILPDSTLRIAISIRPTYAAWVDVDPAEEEHVRAIAEVRSSVVALRDVLYRLQDPHRAYALATEDVEVLTELRGFLAHQRAHMVERIWTAEALSISDLADRIRVSKGRAQQFLADAADTTTRKGDA